MDQVYRVFSGVSEGFFFGLEDEFIDQVMKENGLTIVYDRSGGREVFLHPEVNPEYSETVVRDDSACIPTDEEYYQKTLKRAGRIIGYRDN